MTEQNQPRQGPILSELIEEDPSFVDIVAQFVDGLEARLKKMEGAIRAADFDSLRIAAHQLKGSGGGYGFPILTERAAELEQHAKRAALDECIASFAELKGICDRVAIAEDA